MITLKAWGKVNIGLKIVEKRKDGFHDIETTLTTINLADIITFEETEKEIEFVATGLDIPDDKNLCCVAARLFIEKFNVKKGVRINLTKNIPVGGGLGGGSSDAACVFRGLNKLYGVNVPEQSLFEISREIGSDVPFFIKGGAAYARGKGDELKFFKLPRMAMIIYWPGYPIMTKWAYEEYDKTLLTSQPETDIIVQEQKGKKKKSKPVFNLVNDFEEAVFKKHPDLLDVKTNLLGCGAYIVNLSGSGSCLFVVVDENIRKGVMQYLEGIGAQYFEVVTI
ncbi:MAG: 4-(cytidine 5'-diphospho)-2-C-methyl-D-erythritol kinase [bacterium]